MSAWGQDMVLLTSVVHIADSHCLSRMTFWMCFRVYVVFTVPPIPFCKSGWVFCQAVSLIITISLYEWEFGFRIILCICNSVLYYFLVAVCQVNYHNLGSPPSFERVNIVRKGSPIISGKEMGFNKHHHWFLIIRLTSMLKSWSYTINVIECCRSVNWQCHTNMDSSLLSTCTDRYFWCPVHNDMMGG